MVAPHCRVVRTIHGGEVCGKVVVNMDTAFERIQVEVAGRSITITSWYDFTGKQFHAAAPAFLHLINDSDSTNPQNRSTTREGAIRSVRDRLATRLTEQDAKRRW